MTRGKKNRRRRRRPGFARGPLPAAAGEKARGRERPPEGWEDPVALGGARGCEGVEDSFSSYPVFSREISFFFSWAVYTNYIAWRAISLAEVC
jgi:hypothetical protein